MNYWYSSIYDMYLYNIIEINEFVKGGFLFLCIETDSDQTNNKIFTTIYPKIYDRLLIHVGNELFCD